MTKEEKELLLKDLCARLPYNVKVAIDFQSYIAWLPADEELDYPYRKHLNLVLDCKKKTIEDISSEPNILYAYPCKERFQMLHGYAYHEDYGVPVKFIKPYLRPLSSMTEEEKEELLTLLVGKDAIDCFQIENNQITNTDEHIQFGPNWEYHWINFSNENISLYVGWANKHHFDYRGLIPMGLALVAPEGIYGQD